MKGKIKITTKMLKRYALIAILVVLVVGLSVLVIRSFGDGNILSNNTVLNEIDYSGEYRLYLEKQLIAKSNKEKGYATIIEERIEQEVANVEKQQEIKLTEITATYEKAVENAETTYNDNVAKETAKTEAAIQAIEEDEKMSDSNKSVAITDLENKLKEYITTEEKNANATKKSLLEKYNQDLINHEADTKRLKESVDEEYVAGLIVNELLLKPESTPNNPQYYTLTEVIKRVENTPTGYVYSSSVSENSAIKAEFDLEKTNEANTEGSIRLDALAGLTFTIPNDDTEYIYSSKGGSVVYNVTVPVEGFYNILLDYIPYSSTEAMDASNKGIDEVSGGATIERTFYIDGEIPYDDLSNVSFLRSWADGGEKFIDATGNEIKPKQVERPQRLQQYIKDAIGYVTEPYLVYFTAGEHTIEIESVKENIGIANVYLTSKEKYDSYKVYSEKYKDEKIIEGGIAYKIQGEGGESQYFENNKVKSIFNTDVTRSSSTIYGISDRTSAYNSTIQDGKEIDASPVKIVLNSIGGTKWSSPGDWIKWTVDVEESGLYQISLRSKQNVSRGLFSSRKLTIDGAVPFAEAMNCKFVYGSEWSIVTLGGENNEEYYFYLEAGQHTISLECTLGDYASEIAKIQAIIDDLNAVYRKIIQKTGISPDPYMDYFKNEAGKN